VCNWVLLPDRQNSTERRCPEEGEPYCEEHQLELDYMHRVNEDFEESNAAQAQYPASLKPDLLLTA
jgi:hypothetical protein